MAEFAFYNLGPASVEFDGTDLGESESATLTYEVETADHHTAQYGSSPKDQIYTGNSCEVEIQMKESTLAELNLATPDGTVTTNELMIGNSVGTSLRSSAGKLVIKPHTGGTATSDATKMITVFVAAPVPNWEWTFDDGSTDRMATVTFRAFRATSVPSGETYSIGDMFAVGYGETS